MTRIILIIVSFLLSALVIADDAKRANNPRGYEIDILHDTFGYSQQDIDADLDQVFQGCPRRDCIPSIDQPTFVPATEVDYLDDDDLVMVLDLKGERRAYPTRILDRHEVVNDRFGPTPVAVTFCPLCGSGVTFLRVIEGEEVKLGVSGLLHANDLVLYDRSSNSLWQQVTGKALAGPQRGSKLEAIPSSMTRFGDWRAAHPKGSVLAPPVGAGEYEKNVYGDYASSDRLLFPVSKMDARLHVKRVVYGIELAGQSIALESGWLESAGRWERTLGEQSLVVQWAPASGVFASLDGEPVAVHRMYWFAWYSFHPDTALIDGNNH